MTAERIQKLYETLVGTRQGKFVYANNPKETAIFIQEMAMLTREFYLLQHNAITKKCCHNDSLRILINAGLKLAMRNAENQYFQVLSSITILRKNIELVKLLDNEKERHDLAASCFDILSGCALLLGDDELRLYALEQQHQHEFLLNGGCKRKDESTDLQIMIAQQHLKLNNKRRAAEILVDARLNQNLSKKNEIVILRILEGIVRSNGYDDAENPYHKDLNRILCKPCLFSAPAAADPSLLLTLNKAVEQAHLIVRGSTNDESFAAQYNMINELGNRLISPFNLFGANRDVGYTKFPTGWRFSSLRPFSGINIYFKDESTREAYMALSPKQKQIVTDIANATQSRVANCRGILHTVAYVLSKMPGFEKMRLTSVNIANSDHGFLAINMDISKVRLPPSEWNCYFIDGWRPGNRDGRYVFHSSEISERLDRMKPVLKTLRKIPVGEYNLKFDNCLDDIKRLGELSEKIILLPSDLTEKEYLEAKAAHEKKYKHVIGQLKSRYTPK